MCFRIAALIAFNNHRIVRSTKMICSTRGLLSSLHRLINDKCLSLRFYLCSHTNPIKFSKKYVCDHYNQNLCNAATKIQASFRGHQSRKEADKVQEAQAQKELQEQQDKEDIEKIDLADPDLNKAATKIQASFRGHKVRKDVPN